MDDCEIHAPQDQSHISQYNAKRRHQKSINRAYQVNLLSSSNKKASEACRISSEFTKARPLLKSNMEKQRDSRQILIVPASQLSICYDNNKAPRMSQCRYLVGHAALAALLFFIIIYIRTKHCWSALPRLAAHIAGARGYQNIFFTLPVLCVLLLYCVHGYVVKRHAPLYIVGGDNIRKLY